MARPSKYRQTVTMPSEAVNQAVRAAAEAKGLSVSRFMLYATLKVLKINDQGEEMPRGWSPYGL